MKTFALTRASDSAQAIATAAKATTAQQGAEIRFIGGGTTLIDLMKLNVEQPKTLIDINRLPLDKIETLPNGDNDWRWGAQLESLLTPSAQKRLRGTFRSALERCLYATSHHGDHCGQSIATHALHVFSRDGYAVQQARAWVGLRGNKWSKSQSGHSWNERTLYRDESVRYERGHGRARSDDSRARDEGRAGYSDRGLSRVAREHAGT
jgi:hypothetical protein